MLWKRRDLDDKHFKISLASSLHSVFLGIMSNDGLVLE